MALPVPRRVVRILKHPGTWIVVALLLGAAGYGVWRARGPLVRTVAPIRQDLEQHLVASGRVRVATRVRVSAQLAGRVLAVAVREGQRVKSGELLVQLDDGEARAALATAQAAVDQARAHVDEQQRLGVIVASEDLVQAHARAELAQLALGRIEALSTQGVVSKTELDSAQQDRTLAHSQELAAEAREAAALPLGTDARIALSALLQAEAQLAGAGVRLGQMRIVALEDALVLTRSVEPGDTVQASITLLELALEAEGAQFTFQADERSLATLQLGQTARVAADAYPLEPFEALVSYLAPSVDPERGSIEVRLRATHPPAFLKPDMTVSIDLTVARKQNVLTLPADAVHAAASGSAWIQAVAGQRIARKEVSLGLRGEGTLEIVSPLDAGTQVLLPDATRLVEGQRVRVARKED